MTRRRFLYILLATGITLLAGLFIFRSFPFVVERILEKQLSYLKIQPGAVASFRNDIARTDYYEKKDFGWKKQWFVRIFSLVDNSWFSLPGKSRYDLYTSFFVSDFLLSTDFFLNKMNEDKQVNYLALYDPYKRACSNPFSNLFYPAA